MADQQAAQAAQDAASSGVWDLFKVLVPAALTGAATAWANSTRKISGLEKQVAGMEVSLRGVKDEVENVRERVDKIYDHLLTRKER